MVVCVCTGITDGKLRTAVEVHGATSALEAFEVLGLHPDCRRCQASMEAAVDRIRAGQGDAVEVEAGAWTCKGRCVPSWGMPRTAFVG